MFRERQLMLLNLIVIVSSVGYGISFPLLSMNLEAMGVSGRLIGLNAAMPALGWLIGSMFLSSAQAKFGLKALLICFIVIAILAMIGFSTSQNFIRWTMLRVLFGGGMGLFFRIIEFWINSISPNERRGTNIGIYVTSFMLGLAIGSSIQPSLGHETILPYLVIIGILLIKLGLVYVFVVDIRTRKTLGVSGFTLSLALALPITLAAVFAYGLNEDIMAYLMSVYAIKNGLGYEVAAYTLTAAAVGNLFIPLILGWLSDRSCRMSIILLGAAMAVISTAIIPFTLQNPMVFLIVIVVWSGSAGGLYSVSLSIVGDRYTGHDLIRANVTFGVVYAVGSIIGPLINGYALDQLQSQGLLVSAGLINGVFFLLVLFFIIRKGYVYG